MVNIINKISKFRKLKHFKKLNTQINTLESKISKMSDQEIKEKFLALRDVDINNNELILGFAMIREAAKRTLDMRHFDVQILGGLALYHGNIAEMKTGEGKTLTSTLAVSMLALKRSVHVITVNDYLAARDQRWMDIVYRFLGLKSNNITEKTTDEEKHEIYKNSDIIYSTTSNMGFDYLRDNMKYSVDEISILNKGLECVLIDEIDSILIDEARTPLVISGQDNSATIDHLVMQQIAEKLSTEHFTIDEQNKQCFLTDSGVDFVEIELQKLNIIQEDQGIFDNNSIFILNSINQAIKANYLFKKDREYVVNDNKIQIVDELSGRIMEDRRYGEGLHQAIEAKESIEVQKENQTLASITIQNFFRKYDHICGMTGTATTEEEEFNDIYGLKVVEIKPNKTNKRKDLNDMIFLNTEDKISHIIERIKEVHQTSQPILIGTTDVSKSEKMSELLTQVGINHNVLNAKYHQREAHIIAQAGRLNAVTVATNMAGRGTDILLGGNLGFLIADQNINDEESINALDLELQAEREKIIKLGGLCVIAVERHENRRIDNQLIGRAARQGDPGITQFFMSTQDDLLRIFGGDKMNMMMSRFGFKAGESIDHPMLNGIVQRSQKKIENINYEMRKNLLKYDDIFNEQREIFYSIRLNIIKENDTQAILFNLFETFLAENLNKSFNLDSLKEFGESLATLENEFEFLKLLNLSENDSIESASKKFSDFVINRIQNKISNTDKNKAEISQIIVRNIILSNMDLFWLEYMKLIDHIRNGIHLRSYGQKDPLIEFKLESFSKFDKTIYEYTLKSVEMMILINIE